MIKPLDEYSPQNGFRLGEEICPVCGDYWFPHRIGEKAIDRHGNVFDSITNGDPNDGPYFCPECFKRVKIRQLKRDNQTLKAFK